MTSRLRDLLKELPVENKATLQYLLRHLRRVVEAEEDTKMTPSSLGIIFGPTLLRPRPTEATVSLSSLVDYPHQARIVEILISFYSVIFEVPAEEAQEESATSEVGVRELCPGLLGEWGAPSSQSPGAPGCSTLAPRGLVGIALVCINMFRGSG
ncbi:rho GTPase-activating protein 45-like [Vombatus ursinus]|uniref:rho GTPase-activating protein 45-like n=1 Tax=Vombatus ursinus TaxID=29139 RepID=UPI000FFD8DB4|nr:rho GTPase-activating protein 45-like [Vombatus ursinus]